MQQQPQPGQGQNPEGPNNQAAPQFQFPGQGGWQPAQMPRGMPFMGQQGGDDGEDTEESNNNGMPSWFQAPGSFKPNFNMGNNAFGQFPGTGNNGNMPTGGLGNAFSGPFNVGSNNFFNAGGNPFGPPAQGDDNGDDQNQPQMPSVPMGNPFQAGGGNPFQFGANRFTGGMGPAGNNPFSFPGSMGFNMGQQQPSQDE